MKDNPRVRAEKITTLVDMETASIMILSRSADKIENTLRKLAQDPDIQVFVLEKHEVSAGSDVTIKKLPNSAPIKNLSENN